MSQEKNSNDQQAGQKKDMAALYIKSLSANEKRLLALILAKLKTVDSKQ